MPDVYISLFRRTLSFDPKRKDRRSEQVCFIKYIDVRHGVFSLYLSFHVLTL